MTACSILSDDKAFNNLLALLFVLAIIVLMFLGEIRSRKHRDEEE